MSEDARRYLVRYTGRVQGVGFRATTVSLAANLPISGCVRNNDDGSVTLDVEGETTHVEELLRRIGGAMKERILSTSIDRRTPIGRTGRVRVEF